MQRQSNDVPLTKGQTSRRKPATSVFEPGCMKTLCCYYNYPVILGGLMRRFVEEADRGQWTYCPKPRS